MESKLDSTLSSKNIVRRGLIFQFGKTQIKSLIYQSSVGIAFSHEKRENGKIFDEKFLTGKSDEKNEKLSSLK